MKANTSPLYSNDQVAENVSKYAYDHSTDLPNHILDHHAWGNANHENPNMMISPLQSKFQIFMARAFGAKRVLEIGCFIGFSAMGWSEAVGSDGHVTTLEFKPKYAKVAEETWAKNGIKNIEVVVGPARDSIKTLIETLTQPYDLIFIDADKQGYPGYLELILSLSKPESKVRLLKPNGIIMADNILRRGLVADDTPANPWYVKLDNNEEDKWQKGDLSQLRKFNDLLVGEKRVESFLLPLFDGLGMGRLRD